MASQWYLAKFDPECEQAQANYSSSSVRLLLNAAAVRRDIAILSFLEALDLAQVRSLTDVQRSAPSIRANADRLAGFDAIATISHLAATRAPGDERFDIKNLRSMVVQSAAAKLARTPLVVFRKVAELIGDLSLGHEVQTVFERLEATVRRADADWDARLSEAGQLFMEGKLEIAEIGRLLSAKPSDVAAEFEQKGLIRSLATLRLSPEERQRRLLMMERHRAAGVTASPALVARDVIASQRIEGIDARSHLDTSSHVE